MDKERLFQRMEDIVAECKLVPNRKWTNDTDQRQVRSWAHKVFVQCANEVLPKLQELFGAAVAVYPEAIVEGGYGRFLSINIGTTFSLSVNVYGELCYDFSRLSSRECIGKVAFGYHWNEQMLEGAFQEILLNYIEAVYDIVYGKSEKTFEE